MKPDPWAKAHLHRTGPISWGGVIGLAGHSEGARQPPASFWLTTSPPLIYPPLQALGLYPASLFSPLFITELE